ncbi:2',3'-cyclic-nucleotide 3'-phosphodiesterase [Octopus bimaculoides]|uniref:2',3'-cyclic-nucleotide 3'-phosphodiesterase n=1 Tax=Octopus bimaculoides TaxID=37653 RepID=A0A0L8IFZ2_OCTBM|nr:2',3'-cyclic-nucleotide 3'-phosphodiesterase [Octopus bimaculoides]XP_014768143.1 2',3'-cyclic-nucleotide 3'-phosphodiesterase [Octopus bimaculoides]|eukprot:XP_014768136.1 PREDICTED: 2',3'-cyclic-nucleotide 3'-phosphodiesterase-like [Octopus bimaculoides]
MGKRGGKKRNTNKKCPETVQFHFLENQEVIGKIGTQFQIMFIMRGLPGSGKSTLAESITDLCPTAVVCSSDHFLTENDIYSWTPERCNFGHKYCSELASRSCEMKCPIIVIDNTNIQKKDVNVYTDIASKYGYITILVTPNTPWKFDAFQLEKRCSHGVPLHAIRYKLTLYDEITPIFYAWFLAQEDANHITEMALELFLQSLKEIPEFSLQLSAMYDTETDYNPKHHYDSSEIILSYCVAHFHSGNTNFHKRKSVKKSIGKTFQLCVSQILITPNILAALVNLSEEQLEIYGESELGSPCGKEEEEEEEEEEEQEQEFTVVGKKSHQDRKRRKSSTENVLSEESMEILKHAVEDKLQCVLSQITPGVGFNRPGKQNLKEAEFGSNAGKESIDVSNSLTGNDQDSLNHSSRQASKENNENSQNHGKLKSNAVEIPVLGENSSKRYQLKEIRNVGEVTETRQEDEVTQKNTVQCGRFQTDAEPTKKNVNITKGRHAYILLASRDKIDFNEISKEIRKVSELKDEKEGNLKQFLKFFADNAQGFYFGNGTFLMNLTKNIYLNSIYACQY